MSWFHMEASFQSSSCFEFLEIAYLGIQVGSARLIFALSTTSLHKISEAQVVNIACLLTVTARAG